MLNTYTYVLSMHFKDKIFNFFKQILHHIFEGESSSIVIV